MGDSNNVMSMSLSVCLFVFWFVCMCVCSHDSKSTQTNFAKFFVHVAMTQSSNGVVMRYVGYFLFVGDVMLSHGVCGQWSRIKHDVISRRSSSAGHQNNCSVWSSS